MTCWVGHHEKSSIFEAKIVARTDPATCCYVSTARDHPIQLWDAYTGQMRASYTTIAKGDLVCGPNAACFTPSGTHIIAGLESHLQIFDVSRSGSEGRIVRMVPSRKSKGGQKGIVSTVAFSPDGSGLFAVGTFNQNIGLYDSASWEMAYILEGVRGGITQVQFSNDGKYLYSAARKANELLCWDVRNTGKVLFNMSRTGMTNQRLYYDLHPGTDQLVTGDQNGNVLVYDLKPESDEATGCLSLSYNIATAPVCAASFHPTLPMIATASGERRVARVDLDEDEDSESEDEVAAASGGGAMEIDKAEPAKKVQRVEGGRLESQVTIWRR
ncbi:hypothetical protein HK101_004564 [Irineochytrium annulatum]|nr:hypothetical protein HK101_004564 [Irineochytrium annulatum]